MMKLILALLATSALCVMGIISLEQNKSLFVLCLGALSFILIDLAYEFYKLTQGSKSMAAVAMQYRFYLGEDWSPWFLCSERTFNDIDAKIEKGMPYQTRTLGVTEMNSSDSHSANGGGE